MQNVVVDMSDTGKKSEATQPTAAPGSMSADWAKFGEKIAELVGATTEVQPQRMTNSMRDAMERVAWARTAPISQTDSDFLRDHSGLDDSTILDDWSAEKEAQRRAEVAVASAVQLVADTLSREEVGHVLEIDDSNVSRRAKKNQLYSVNRDGRPRFPRWQFRDGQALPGLTKIVDCLERLDLDPVSVGTLMVRPNDELEGLRPVDYLAAGGDPDSMVALLRSTERHASRRRAACAVHSHRQGHASLVCLQPRGTNCSPRVYLSIGRAEDVHYRAKLRCPVRVVPHLTRHQPPAAGVLSTHPQPITRVGPHSSFLIPRALSATS